MICNVFFAKLLISNRFHFIVLADVGSFTGLVGIAAKKNSVSIPNTTSSSLTSTVLSEINVRCLC